MHPAADMEAELMSYCLKWTGKWWANHFFRNREANELYAHLRSLDAGTVAAILGCGCVHWEHHLEEYREAIAPLLDKPAPRHAVKDGRLVRMYSTGGPAGTKKANRRPI